MIVLDGVSKSFDGGRTFVVRDLHLRAEEGERIVLLGSSGCGKTTTLKMINRLVEPTGGTLLVAGRDVRQQNPIELRRTIGYAIQGVGLFPHMTVAQNVGVVPSLLGWDARRRNEAVDRLLSMVRLDPAEYRDRLPSQLSGGQRQRIGVARALAADPPIILMDEPFGALDPITREQLQEEFLDLIGSLNKTVIFVTHDVFEAVRMADRIALLHDGAIQQIATPAELVDRPANAFVEQFLGRHRFQLAMLTRGIGPLAEHAETPGDSDLANALPARASLIDAMDAFKTTGRDRLPITRGGTFVGWLRRGKLAGAIDSLMTDQEGQP